MREEREEYIIEPYNRKSKKEKRYRIGGPNRVKKKQKLFIGIVR